MIIDQARRSFIDMIEYGDSSEDDVAVCESLLEDPEPMPTNLCELMHGIFGWVPEGSSYGHGAWLMRRHLVERGLVYAHRECWRGEQLRRSVEEVIAHASRQLDI